MKSVFLSFLVICLAALPLSARAQNNGQPPTGTIKEGPSCDRDVLKAINDVAWMSAQRDIEISAKLIYKPDSVLQYSCFRNHNSSSWLTGGLGQYIDDNFGKAFVGGAPCVQMSGIWHGVKCIDFDIMNFMTYQEHRDFDPRIFYKKCVSDERNREWARALIGGYPPPAKPARNGGADLLETFVKMMYAFAGQCSDAQPIPTGVKMTAQNKNFNDAVCPVPGCYYDGQRCTR